MWDGALKSAAEIFRELAERGITSADGQSRRRLPDEISASNVPAVKQYGNAIFRALSKHFGNRIPETIIEPGRGMVGNAGVIEAEVVLISKKSQAESELRWVYLDIGKFNGLAETIDEMIRYPIRTEADGAPTAPCVIAGPSCDSVDVLYEKKPYDLPVSPGDRHQGADRGNGRLYDDLFGGRLQRLPAARDLHHLKGCGNGARRGCGLAPLPNPLPIAGEGNPLRHHQSRPAGASSSAPGARVACPLEGGTDDL